MLCPTAMPNCYTDTKVFSVSKICTVCRGLDEFRNLKFKDTLSEFTNKIEIFKELTKSFNDNNSTLNHALDTIKHFILRLKPSEINDKFAEIDGSLNTLSSKVASLPDTSFFGSKIEDVITTVRIEFILVHLV